MRLLIALPLLLLLVLFALSNSAPVRLASGPRDYALELPLSLAILGRMALPSSPAVFWSGSSELGQRRRARRARADVDCWSSRCRSCRPGCRSR